MFSIQAHAILQTMSPGQGSKFQHLIETQLEAAYQRGLNDKAREVCAVLNIHTTEGQD